jgi:hypothetical protein
MISWRCKRPHPADIEAQNRHPLLTPPSLSQKQALPHGLFLPWIEAEFEMSQRAAYRFINVTERYGAGKLATVATLNVKAIYELAAPSTPPEVRDEIDAG